MYKQGRWREIIVGGFCVFIFRVGFCNCFGCC